MTLSFTIDGTPRAWQRAIPIDGKPGRRRDPNKDAKKRIWALALIAARKAKFRRIDRGPVAVSMDCHFQRPQRGHAGETWYCARGRHDSDNLCKILLDSLNGVAWDDDGQVAELTIRKLYTDTGPRTVVTVRGLNQEVTPR